MRASRAGGGSLDWLLYYIIVFTSICRGKLFMRASRAGGGSLYWLLYYIIVSHREMALLLIYYYGGNILQYSHLFEILSDILWKTLYYCI